MLPADNRDITWMVVTHREISMPLTSDVVSGPRLVSMVSSLLCLAADKCHEI